MDMSKIEWTERTWNPFAGCSVTSAGCKNCYAMRMAGRLQKMNPDSHYAGTTKVVNDQVVWTGKIAVVSDAKWTEPLRRKTPTVYFVNSMGDMFHPNVSDELIDRAFAVMAHSPQHTFQILTKYPERMRVYFDFYGHGTNHRSVGIWLAQRHDIDFDDHRSIELPLPNVWLGVSVESADHLGRLDALRETPAAIRFVSFEPLLGPINDVNFTDIDWAIIGGESGKGSRPMHPDWALSLRDQCLETRTLFFFKQWGAFSPIDPVNQLEDAPQSQTFRSGVAGFHEFPDGHQMQRVGKSHAGRLLDGQIWNERPLTITESEGK